MPLLPSVSLVLLPAALSIIYHLSTRFDPSSNHHAQRYFSCSYCLVSLVLLYLLSTRFHPNMINDTFGCPDCRCFAVLFTIYNLSTRFQPNYTFSCPYFLCFSLVAHCCPVYNLPSLPSFSPTLSTILSCAAAFDFPVSCSLQRCLQSTISLVFAPL
jgi:hypothetical protein